MIPPAANSNDPIHYWSFTWRSDALAIYGIGTIHSGGENLEAARTGTRPFLLSIFDDLHGPQNCNRAAFERAMEKDLAAPPINVQPCADPRKVEYI